MKSFASSLATYLKAAKSWLTDEESPIVTALEHTAEELDKKVTGNLLSQYRLLLKELDLRKPVADSEGGDELDSLIPE